MPQLPETDYAFKPSSMPEVRTFGKLFGHVNEQKTTKAEIVKALADSFAHCNPAFASLTEESGTQITI